MKPVFAAVPNCRWLPGALVSAALALAGCGDLGSPDEGRDAGPARLSMTRQQLTEFQAVAARVEPVAELMCDRLQPELNCDYEILIDPDPRAPMNAFQTVNRSGRPTIVFTRRMIAEFANREEMAFVIAHEAAHHIGRHIPARQQSAMIGGVLMGLAAVALAGDAPAQEMSETVDSAMQLGAFVGSRVYSKGHEIEADQLGAAIAEQAGYDSVIGVQLFYRMPDPGNEFLGSHPPNAQRIDAVSQVAARF